MDIQPTHTCFDDALEFVELMIVKFPGEKDYFKENLRIVHGICLLEDSSQYAHAWVEDIKDQTCVFRGIANGEFVWLSASITEYYANFQVQETTKYTLRQACDENQRTMSYGPWEERYLALTRSRLNTAVNQ